MEDNWKRLYTGNKYHSPLLIYIECCELNMFVYHKQCYFGSVVYFTFYITLCFLVGASVASSTDSELWGGRCRSDFRKTCNNVSFTSVLIEIYELDLKCAFAPFYMLDSWGIFDVTLSCIWSTIKIMLKGC